MKIVLVNHPESPSIREKMERVAKKLSFKPIYISHLIKKSQKPMMYVENGMTVPDNEIVKVLLNTFQKKLEGYLVLGFPRTNKQLTLLLSNIEDKNSLVLLSPKTASLTNKKFIKEIKIDFQKETPEYIFDKLGNVSD